MTFIKVDIHALNVLVEESDMKLCKVIVKALGGKLTYLRLYGEEEYKIRKSKMTHILEDRGEYRDFAVYVCACSRSLITLAVDVHEGLSDIHALIFSEESSVDIDTAGILIACP
jgi:hypothetical protein